jgi:hypothetical protein
VRMVRCIIMRHRFLLFGLVVGASCALAGVVACDDSATGPPDPVDGGSVLVDGASSRDGGPSSGDTPCGPAGKTVWAIGGPAEQTWLYRISLEADGWDEQMGDVRTESKNAIHLWGVTEGCGGLCAHANGVFLSIDLSSFDGTAYTAKAVGTTSTSFRGLSNNLLVTAGKAIVQIGLNPYVESPYASPTYPGCTNNAPAEPSDVEGADGNAVLTVNCGGSNVSVIARLNGGNLTLSEELVGERLAGLHGNFAVSESGNIYDIGGGGFALHRTTRICRGAGNPTNGTSFPLRAID